MNKPVRKHFVEFLSPGTFSSESDYREIPEWDPKLAAEMSKNIVQRYGARPYGFVFSTVLTVDPIPDGEGGTLKVEPKTVKESGTHFLGGKILRYEQVPDDDEHRILRSNMRLNGWPLVVNNTNSFRSTHPFKPDDVLLDYEGNIIVRGTTNEIKEYREHKIAEWESEWAKSR